MKRDQMDQDTLALLTAFNTWLTDVYGKEMRLSTLLRESGISEEDLECIKTRHLTSFMQSILNLIINNVEKHDGERRNSVMVRYYGLETGKPETLQNIGDSLGLSRERIRQLVQKRIVFYKIALRKAAFKADLTMLVRNLMTDAHSS
jgi:DNA-directed RNA polymerase sigma subunit (sigma70/sigma32)